ncbi:Aste57867_11954 [Aphanomyces stellatus]|uniref:Aste57867_11954 protein n=1 Tax=Aphanomyces stellatus TaxID=120398 RepID=A0A485KWA8_9STRA|nr:hypothetical protein As57867_011909 [Aphanomyces stellatus]VFT88809.1 Aste57867_11954 [Aphanomyces stellatus]
MGAGASSIVQTEREKPVDASDIPDGDWAAAKREVVRLRQLLADPSRSPPSSHARRWTASRLDETGVFDPKSSDESPEGRALWSAAPTHDKRSPSTRATSPAPQRRSLSSRGASADEAEIDPKSSDESAEGRALWSHDQHSTFTRSGHHHMQRAASGSGSPTAQDDEMDAKSPDESPAGRAVWATPHHDTEFIAPDAVSLLDNIRLKVFERYDSLHASFLKLDMDKSGYISEDEFRLCMANMGFHMTDDEFELLQISYPHKEATGETDKGIGYLEFVKIMTDELQYTPGEGEDEADGQYARLTTAGSAFRSTHDDRPITGSIRQATTDLGAIKRMFTRQIFGLYKSMKDAFKAADRDGSGFIELGEFTRLLRDTLGIDADEGQAREMLRHFDTNGDGKLAYSEFVKCLRTEDRGF